MIYQCTPHEHVLHYVHILYGCERDVSSPPFTPTVRPLSSVHVSYVPPPAPHIKSNSKSSRGPDSDTPRPELSERVLCPDLSSPAQPNTNAVAWLRVLHAAIATYHASATGSKRHTRNSSSPFIHIQYFYQVDS